MTAIRAPVWGWWLKSVFSPAMSSGNKGLAVKRQQWDGWNGSISAAVHLSLIVIKLLDSLHLTALLIFDCDSLTVFKKKMFWGNAVLAVCVVERLFVYVLLSKLRDGFQLSLIGCGNTNLLVIFFLEFYKMKGFSSSFMQLTLHWSWIA